MNQLKMSYMLKGIVIVIGVMGALFFVLMMPMLANDCRRSYSEAAYLYWPGLYYGWAIGVICYLALFQFWKICVEIGRDNSFSKENVKSLNLIGYLAIAAACLWFAGLIVLIVLGMISIGFFVLMFMAIIVSISISIIAIVLSHLVDKAYALKQENELTI